MRILYYDIETASSAKGSICAVGWVLTDNDAELLSGYQLIDPECGFSGANIKVHGIFPEMVAGKPRFAEYWKRALGHLMTGALVLSHNASFDMSHTAAALGRNRIDCHSVVFMDTLKVFKNSLACESYKLKDLAQEVGVEYKPHNALEDARALFEVTRCAASAAHAGDVPSFLIRSCVAAEVLEPKDPGARADGKTGLPFKEHFHGDVVEKGDELKGKRVVITGDIPGLDRADIERLVQEHGGKTTATISGKTDYLAEGEYPGYEPGFVSGKKRQALDSIAHGGTIRIITIKELFDMMGETLPC